MTTYFYRFQKTARAKAKSFRVYSIMIISLMLLGANVFSQNKYFTRSAHIYFISHTDIIDIDADNHQVGSMFDTKTGEIVFSVSMKSFEFKLALAEEHFNENYVETHKYPKAKFKGKIVDISSINFAKDGIYRAFVEGEMTIHGITKKIKAKGSLEMKNSFIYIKSHINIALSDYDIKVPNIVKDKVAKIINIKINAKYKPYEK